MLDYQRIVDDLRGSLYSQDGQELDFLRSAAAEYSLACDEVNDRLRQCGSFLRQGLRSEAIQLGENEPNLLDIVSILDFPERPEWLEMAIRCGIAAPSILKLEVAAELNQAYALEQPLAELLREHRLLALSHGPLPARIAVLRKLAESDPQNPVWHDDLKIFEGERQKQISVELETAARSGDSNAVAKLNTELTSPEWKNPPPKDLVASAADSLAQMQYWSIQAELQKTAEELEASMTAFDIERGRTLREKWDKIIAGYGHQPQETTARKALPALCWLEEVDDLRERQERQQAALEELTTAVRTARSSGRLGELHQEAEKLGPLPSDLEEAYQARLAALERSAFYRGWAGRVGIFAAAAVLTIFAGAFLTRYFHEREVQAASSSMNKMIAAGQYEEAKTLLRELPDTVREAPPVQEMAALLQKMSDEERARETEFTQQLQAAKLALEALAKSLASEPNPTVLERAGRDLQRYRKQFDDLQKMAKTEDDRKNLSAAIKFSADVNDKWQHLTDRAFDRQYADFEKRLAKLESPEPSEAENRRETARKLRADITACKLASTRISLAEQQRFSAIDDRLALLENNLAEQEQEDADLKKLTAAIGDAKAYVQALGDFATAHPKADSAAAFKRVAEESSTWEAMAEWNDFARQMRQTGLLGMTPADAQKHAELLEKVTQKFADSNTAMHQFIERALPALKAVAQRVEDGERIEAPLKKMFLDPLVADVWMIEKQDGARYYLETEPDLKQSGSILYIITFDRKTKGAIVKEEDVKFAGRAPQVAVAARVRPILSALNTGNWEKSFNQMLAIIAADSDMDPFLKFNLLQQVLETAAKGSFYFSQAYARHLDWLQEARLNATANWLDPKNMSPSARESAAKVVKSFPDVAPAGQSLEKQLKSLEKNKIPEYRWAGWLRRPKDGRWQCVMERETEAGGNLFALGQSSANGKTLLAPIGRVENQKTTIDAKGNAILLEGRPVYLEIP